MSSYSINQTCVLCGRLTPSSMCTRCASDSAPSFSVAPGVPQHPQRAGLGPRTTS
jgi:hypothetical protein